jgi:hypothetical protein
MSEQPSWLSPWKDPERHRDQVNRRNRAWARAVKLLIDENEEEYNRLYAQQCLLETPQVTPRPRRSESEELKQEIARLQAQLARMNGESGG